MKPKLIKFDGKALGWRRDSIDTRDFVFRRSDGPKHIPAAVDLRPHCIPPMDQLALGSCVPHGVTACLRYTLMMEGVKDRPLSRLQNYYDGRVIEDCVKIDSGLEIRDAIKCAAELGVAVEGLWPYNIDRFKQKPFPRVYENALKFKALTYKRVAPNASSIKAAIASGWPVVGGFNCYDSILSDECARTGDVAMPGIHEAPVGGHCIYLPAYGQRPGRITGRNSWTDRWGDKGDCYFPEEYLEQYGSDYWIITKVGLQ